MHNWLIHIQSKIDYQCFISLLYTYRLTFMIMFPEHYIMLLKFKTYPPLLKSIQCKNICNICNLFIDARRILLLNINVKTARKFINHIQNKIFSPPKNYFRFCIWVH